MQVKSTLNIILHQWKWHISKSLETASAGEVDVRQEPSSIFDEIVIWFNFYEKQYKDLSNKQEWNSHMQQRYHFLGSTPK